MHTPSRPLNSWDLLKCLGLLLMFVDHAGAFFFIHDPWLRAIGRGSAPIFLFLAGYASSYRFSRELFILAWPMTLSNILMGEYTNPLNILVTILLCRAVLDKQEQKGKRIEKPFEWFVGSAVFILITCFFFQYGTLGLLFAISGYMKRRGESYTTKTQSLFLIATFAAYALTFVFLFSFRLPAALLMCAVLVVDYLLLWHMKLFAVDAECYPRWLVWLLKASSDYSAYIYVIHMIILSWITHIPL